MFRLFKYTFFTLLFAIVAGTGYLLTQPCTPYTRAEIRSLTDRLNEEAAVRVPHHSLMPDDMREAHADLIARVDKGEELTAEETLDYRKLGLANLYQSQTFLSYLDMNFQTRKDHGMEMKNNVGGHGIEGTHDHHDASARANFDEILTRLDGLKDQNFLSRIWSTITIYKNTADLVIHMGPAPQSVSIPYTPPPEPWSDPEMGALFETMLMGYKETQFAPVNSAAYVTPLHTALDAYDQLVYSIQSKVAPQMGWADCRIAGNWLSIQQVAPQLDPDMFIRFPRPPLE